MLTPAQQAKRQTGIGASEVAGVLGLSPYQTPLDVYTRKVGGEHSEETPAMHWGSALEAVIGRHYSQLNNVKLRKGRTVRSKKNPIMLATPDYIRMDDGRPIQVKTARTADGWGPDGSPEVPLGYAVQVAWEMAVLDRPAAVLAVLIGGSDYRQYDLTRDLETEALMIERVNEFWQNHVHAHIPPPARDPQEAKEYLQKLWRNTTGNLVEASHEVAARAAELARARLEFDAAEDKVTALENDLKRVIGDTDGLIVGDSKITWRHNPEDWKTDWKALAMFDLKATPELVAKRSVLVPGSRVFRVTGPLFKEGQP